MLKVRADGHVWWASLMLAFLTVPFFAMWLGLIKYVRANEKQGSTYRKYVVFGLLAIPFLDIMFMLLTVPILGNALSSMLRITDRGHVFMKTYHAARVMVESALEAIPQFVLQVYISFKVGDDMWALLPSLVVSVVSFAWTWGNNYVQATKEGSTLKEYVISLWKIGGGGFENTLRLVRSNNLPKQGIISFGPRMLSDGGLFAGALAYFKGPLLELDMAGNVITALGKEKIGKALLKLPVNDIRPLEHFSCKEYTIEENDETLQLEQCQLTAPDLTLIAGVLRHHAHLRRLNLRGNEIGEGHEGPETDEVYNVKKRGGNGGCCRSRGGKGPQKRKSKEKHHGDWSVQAFMALGDVLGNVDETTGLRRTLLNNSLAPGVPLTELDLSNNRITAQDALPLAQALLENGTLTLLNLNSNRLGAGFEQNAEEVGAASGKKKKLTQLLFQALGAGGGAGVTNLLLANNFMNDDDVDWLSQGLQAEPNVTMTALDISSNKRIGAAGKDKLGTVLPLSRTPLQQFWCTEWSIDANDKEPLDLSGKQLLAADAKLLASVLRSFPLDASFQTLNVLGNSFQEGAAHITAAFEESSTLQSLCGLAPTDTAAMLADGIVKCAADLQFVISDMRSHPALTELDLRQNAIGGKADVAEVLASFAAALSEHPNMTDVRLGANGLKPADLAALTAGLSGSCRLRTLDLGSNDHMAGSEESVPAFMQLGTALAANTSLTELSLSGNGLSAAEFTPLASGLARNTALTVLDLTKNCLEDKDKMEFGRLLWDSSGSQLRYLLLDGWDLSQERNTLDVSTLMRSAKPVASPPKKLDSKRRFKSAAAKVIVQKRVARRGSVGDFFFSMWNRKHWQKQIIPVTDEQEITAGDNRRIHLASHGDKPFGEADAHLLAPLLRRNAQLTWVNLLGLDLGAGADVIVDAFEQTSSLKSLCGLGPGQDTASFANAGLGGSSSILLAAELKLGSTLTSLDIRGNPFDDTILVALGTALHSNAASRLRCLSCDGWRIEAGSQEVSIVPYSIEREKLAIGDVTLMTGVLKGPGCSITSVDAMGQDFGEEGVRLLVAALEAQGATLRSVCGLGTDQLEARFFNRESWDALLLVADLKAHKRLESLDIKGSFSCEWAKGVLAVAINESAAPLAHVYTDTWAIEPGKAELQRTREKDGARLNAADAQLLTAVLGNNQRVTALDLRGDHLGTEGALIMAKAIKSNTSLVALNLLANKIDDPSAAKAVADAFAANSKVATICGVSKIFPQTFKLGTCRFQGAQLNDSDAILIAAELKKNPLITSMNVMMNDFTEAEGVKAITEAFEQIASLKSICGLQPGEKQANFAKQGLTAIDALFLAADVKQNGGNLVSLNIDNNRNIGTAGTLDLLKSLSSSSSQYLATLSLRENGMGKSSGSSRAFEHLGELLRANAGLTELDLAKNEMDAADAAPLFASMASNSGLKRLCLAYNPDVGGDLGDAKAFELLGTSLQQNTTLEKLDLMNTGMTDANLASLVAGLHENATLTDLHLGSNNNIGDAGYQALATALQSSPACLSRLECGLYSITDAKLTVRKNPAQKNLQSGSALLLSIMLRTADTLTEIDFNGVILEDDAKTIIGTAIIDNAAIKIQTMKCHNWQVKKGDSNLTLPVKMEAADLMLVAAAIKSHETLTALSLRGNKLGGTSASVASFEALGKALASNWRHGKLEQLDFSDIGITDADAAGLVEHWTKVTQSKVKTVKFGKTSLSKEAGKGMVIRKLKNLMVTDVRITSTCD